ncbi:hypothetical protein C8F04DRAFT_1122586 [Mycena alexandri]|uniref:Uncharacterized protein n=1 Tax=Mycena alexandri TaxID=1745969 RepID=A0AAD6WXT2_9AGAR|nr:hypothetical protein C8F04DRAFT_1122586 [Mycena alexandri]
MISPFTFVLVTLLQLSMTLAAPVQQPGLIGCNSSNSTKLASDIDGVRFALSNINPSSAVGGNATLTRPIFNAQLALVAAAEATEPIQRIALFPTLAKPAPSNSIQLVLGALVNAQAQMSMIQLSKFATAFANNTDSMASANKFLLEAMDQANNLNCTSQ